MWFIIVIATIVVIITVSEITTAFRKKKKGRPGMKFNWYYDPTGTVLSGIVLALALLVIPLSVRNVEIRMNSFEAKRETLSALRKSGTEGFETATVIGDVMKLNEWLADVQWVKSHKGFNWYIPKEIMNIEPIK